MEFRIWWSGLKWQIFWRKALLKLDYQRKGVFRQGRQKKQSSQAYWCISVILALERLRVEDCCDFQDSLASVVSSRPTWTSWWNTISEEAKRKKKPTKTKVSNYTVVKIIYSDSMYWKYPCLYLLFLFELEVERNSFLYCWVPKDSYARSVIPQVAVLKDGEHLCFFMWSLSLNTLWPSCGHLPQKVLSRCQNYVLKTSRILSSINLFY